MKRTNFSISTLLFFLIIAACTLFPSCARNIYLSDDGYKPGESVKTIKGYKDTQIYLGSFNNRAPKTKRYKYFSTDNSVTYTTKHLVPDYLWYCFKKSFAETGMKVNELDEAPVLYLLINTMNDTEWKFDINVYRGDDLEFVNEMTVTIPPASLTGNDKSDYAILEQNAYNMMDATSAAILNDKKFKICMTKAPASNIATAEKKIEGTLIGMVKAIDPGTNEIIVSSGKIASMVNIGDTVYTINNGVKVTMEVNFPMQTIAKCKIFEKDRKNISKIKNGDMVYK